jgi:DNA adenine methylase
MKYMGSKARLSKDISPIINKLIQENNIDTYIEPFVGGANMIEHIQCKNKIGYDNNEYLMTLWNDLVDGWNPPTEMSREMYDDIKNNKGEYGKSLVAIAGFCATYNSKWFGGYAGKVNTKIGTVRDYYDEAIRNILKQRDRLLDTKFIHKDFKELSPIGCLIYCDPPYQGTTKYGSSKDFDYELFWDKVREWSETNIVLVSEYNAPDDFNCIYEKTLTTTLDKNSRKQDTEKLFIHNSYSEKFNK